MKWQEDSIKKVRSSYGGDVLVGLLFDDQAIVLCAHSEKLCHKIWKSGRRQSIKALRRKTDIRVLRSIFERNIFWKNARSSKHSQLKFTCGDFQIFTVTVYNAGDFFSFLKGFSFLSLLVLEIDPLCARSKLCHILYLYIYTH